MNEKPGRGKEVWLVRWKGGCRYIGEDFRSCNTVIFFFLQNSPSPETVQLRISGWLCIAFWRELVGPFARFQNLRDTMPRPQKRLAGAARPGELRLGCRVYGADPPLAPLLPSYSSPNSLFACSVTGWKE